MKRTSLQVECKECGRVECACEYCEECRRYHARPTYPTCEQWMRQRDRAEKEIGRKGTAL